MELWARGPLGTSVDFLCACVDDMGVASAFGKMFKFERVINGWIPSQAEMPAYGQLGCSGFIVVGGDGRLVSKKTAAFLEQGEDAFAEAERLVRRHLAVETPVGGGGGSGVKASTVAPAAAFPSEYPYGPGCVAVLGGINGEPALNGRRVTVERFNPKTGRFEVSLLGLGSSGGGGDKGAPLAAAAAAAAAAAPAGADHGRGLSVLPCKLEPEDAATAADDDNAPVEVISDDEGKRRRGGPDGGGSSDGGGGGGGGGGEGRQLRSIGAVASVGVAVMDAEHGRCVACLNALLAACDAADAVDGATVAVAAAGAGASGAGTSSAGPTTTSSVAATGPLLGLGRLAAAVVDELEDHFRHEEDLMRSHR